MRVETHGYQRYLALDPTNVAVRADYGKLLAHIGALPRAFLQLERVLREDEPNDAIRKLQVELAMRLGRFADAESHLDILLKKVDGKETAPLLEQLGICQLQRGKNEDAVKSLSAAIAISPEQLSAYSLKAELLSDRLRNSEVANKTIDAMVEANPNSADAYLLYARFVLGGKSLVKTEDRLATATEACGTALKLPPQHAEGLALAALCAQQGGKFAEAIDLLRKSLSVKPDVANRYLQLANVELQAQRAEPAAALEAAISVIRQGLAAIPDKAVTRELRWRLADLLIAKSNKTAPETAELAALRAEMQKEQADSPLIAYLNARQLFEDKNWLEAQRALEANYAKLSSRPDLQTKIDEMLVRCYSQTDNPELQLTASRRLLDKNPLDVSARRDYAEALAGAGQVVEAIGEYEQILRIIGDNAPDALARRYFILKLVEMGQRPKNRRDWAPLKQTLDEAAKKAPNDPWVPLMSAEISLAEEDPEAARLTLETAAKTMENEPALLRALGDLAQGQNDTEEAARRLAEIEKITGDTLETRSAKARFLIHQQGKEGLSQLAEFTQDVDKLPAADQEPERLAQLHWQLAQLSWSQQDAPLGRQYGQQAAKLSPHNLHFRLSLLRNAMVAQDVDAAKQLTAEIQSIDKGGPITLYGQAVYDFTRYLVDKANGQDGAATLSQTRDKLLQAQRLRPTWVQVPLLLGEVAREQKDDETALGYYQSAIELGNRDAATYAQVAFILYHRGQFDDADNVVKSFEQQQNTTTPEIGRLASRISASRNDLERALVMAKIPVELSKTPQRNDILFLGQLYAMQGQFADAQTSLQKAIDLEPTDETAYQAMVQLLVAASQQAESDGKPDDAQRLFADAEAKMAEAEQRVEPRKRAQTAAYCLAFLGKPDDAMQRFEQAINDTPQDTELREAAARFYSSGHGGFGSKNPGALEIEKPGTGGSGSSVQGAGCSAGSQERRGRPGSPCVADEECRRD
ncbi:MAG: tetratricopeptide repeat protein [Pirellulaceae bacterium]